MSEEKMTMTEQELQEYIDSIKITDFNNYVDWANQTLSLKFSTKNVSDVTLHGAIGIVTEAGELMSAIGQGVQGCNMYNLKEEIGDLMWYIACVAKDNDLDFNDLVGYAMEGSDYVGYKPEEDSFKNPYCIDDFTYRPVSDLETSIRNISVVASQLVDILKKSLFYKEDGKVDMDQQVKRIGINLFYIVQYVDRICTLQGWQLKDEVCLINIKKLAKRYGKKFSSDAALKRNLDGEKEILEGK
jgi:hypothetical protein